MLDPDKWTVTEIGTGKKVSREVTDNNPETRWASADGKGLLIDLGREAVVHRVYLTPGEGVTKSYAEVRVTFAARSDGDPLASTRRYSTPTCEWWKVREQRQKLLAGGTSDFLPLNKLEADLKFNPVAARYLRIEGATPIAELEVYGSAGKAAAAKRDAVVLSANAADVLRVAAEDLRYYVGELTGRPIPIIEPGQEGEYPGTLYRIEDLKPRAKTYDEMVANLEAGRLPSGGPVLDTVVSPYTMRLPDGVNAEREGRSVVFRAWPYRNVAYSVWEFLRRQGVVWAYPDSHGDLVPVGKGVDLSILPLRYRPSADLRYANFDTGRDYGEGYPWADQLLFFARNGYGSDWGCIGRALQYDREVPPLPQRGVRTDKDVKPEYTEGFGGYPHNFNGVMPNRILEQHPDWCGMREDGQRLPPNKGGPGTFCMTSPGAIEFVANKMLAWIGDNKDCMVKFNLLPMDGCTYCQCERCLNLYKPFRRPDIPWVPISPYMVSDAYYYFVTEVAKRVGATAPHARIGALAYADVHAPPRNLDSLPDNVWVEVCQYGSRNLPVSSPANAAMRECEETWARKCAHLTAYEYALIHAEWSVPPMPIPLVSAIVDRSKFLHRLGAWNGGTQASAASLTHNPWNWYAYPRMLWDVNLTADQILEEFFTAYYREARGPMLAYYRTLEDHLIRNNVNLQDFAYDQGPNPDAFPPALVEKLRRSLAKAGKAAGRAPWYVKQRVRLAKEDLEWGVAKSARRSMDLATALANGKKSYACHRRRGAIAIDGKLDDEAWKTVPAAGDFITPRENERVPGSEQTEFRVVWDDEKLYVAVRCANANTTALKETDAVWGTDNFEWHLVPERAYTAHVYQTAVSAFNRVWGPKRRFNDQWHTDTEWHAEGLETAVVRGDGFWTCEMALPFKALREGAPKAGDCWRVNISRNRGNGVERASSWSPLLVGAWHTYRDYNFVVFQGDPAATAPPAEKTVK